VILTSSVAAIYGANLPAGKTAFDETIWTDVVHPVGRLAYTKSKTLAEKAAWDYIEAEARELEPTTINPVLVTGVPLDKHFGSSVSVIQRILNGKDPMLPDISFSIVDVKDVAEMHVKAIELDAAKGQRFVASTATLSFVQIAKSLKASFANRKFPTVQAPNILVRFLALFDADIKAVLPALGSHTPVSAAKAQSVFGMKFIGADESLRETAAYLIDNGFR
jgi:dihydroflavonol-4-reductase